MKIESLVRITGGVLLNTPSVTSIVDIQIESKKVKSGSLFIDTNNSNEEIKEAVLNGAYSILTSSISKIIDEEIAWICVEDLNLAMIKLARFYATDKNFKFIPLCTTQYHLAKSIHLKEKASTLFSEPKFALMQIVNSKNDKMFFVLDNLFVDKIDPTIKRPLKRLEPNRLIERGLFFSTFVFDDIYIKDLRLSSLFVPSLCALIKYFKDEKIEFEIENFLNFKHFHAIFVNDKLEKKEFGGSTKAVIIENNLELFKEELNYVQKRVSQNSLIVFIPSKIIDKITTSAIKIVYKEFNEIKTLKDKKFKYILAYSELENHEEFFLKEEKNQMSLF